MGELRFVGLGLSDERDLSERAMAELGECPTLFAERYTSIVAPGSLERLERRLGKRIRVLDREAVELGQEILSALANPEQNPVALLTAGDPFAATTHVALRVAAERAGHGWAYRPNASILTAAPGFLGLMPYRFGRPVSLPFSEPNFQPRSPLEGIRANRTAGAHTLLLLDLRPGEGRFLRANEALQVLSDRDPGGVYVSPDCLFAVVARVGTPHPAAWVGTRSQLSGVDFGPPLHSIVVLAPTLHFEEEAAIARFRVPP